MSPVSNFLRLRAPGNPAWQKHHVELEDERAIGVSGGRSMAFSTAMWDVPPTGTVAGRAHLIRFFGQISVGHS